MSLTVEEIEMFYGGKSVVNNVFFGGVGGVITSAAVLANNLSGVSASDIQNFIIDDDLNVICSIGVPWGFGTGDFPNKSNLTHIIDLQGNATEGIGNDVLRNAGQNRFMFLPRIGESDTIRADFVQNGNTNSIVYIPNAVAGFIFEDQNVRFGYLFLNKIWEGSSDPTIALFEAANGQVVYIQNDNRPPAINEVTINESAAGFVDFSLTFPSHSNVMQFVEIWKDGVFQKISEATNEILLTNLKTNQNNIIDVYVADQYYNRSPRFSFVVNNDFTISENTIGGAYVLLDENFILSNQTKTVEVYANSVLNNTITNAGKGGVYAIGLSELTNYDIYIIIDGNQSNTINLTTTTTPAEYENTVAYYKLDETNGNAIDVVNGNNITLSGGVTQGVAGKVNQALAFGGVDGKATIPLSIYDEFDNDNYTVTFWFSTNDNTKTQILISDFDGTNFEQRKLFAFINGANQTLRFGFGDNGGNIVIDSNTSIANNTLYLCTLKYEINGVAELKLNNVSQGTHTFVNAPQNQTPIQLGLRQNLNDLALDGIIDELNFANGQLTQAQEDAIWNDGDGKTI